MPKTVEWEKTDKEDHSTETGEINIYVDDPESSLQKPDGLAVRQIMINNEIEMDERLQPKWKSEDKNFDALCMEIEDIRGKLKENGALIVEKVKNNESVEEGEFFASGKIIELIIDATREDVLAEIDGVLSDIFVEEKSWKGDKASVHLESILREFKKRQKEEIKSIKQTD